MAEDWAEVSKSMIQKGQDPKDYLIEVCKPNCKFWEDKLKRCENTLLKLNSSDPEKTCMYPARDWITCVDGCVQPRVHHLLRGQEKGIIS